MNSDFESLKGKRKRWVEANRENGFEDGIKRLLTELYPDNAHFVYELLQNAEDTQASEVCFTLNSKGLDFEHNGTRLFSLSDVDSITSIGVSSKRDDPTSIGKFGVGFKAVFAYTNTPEIHSGNYCFRIRDLVVPEAIELQRGVQKTQFIFPFDHSKKSATQAAAEIAKGLRELGDNTLLFLKHIRKIEYLLPDGSIGTIERIEHGDGRIEIRSRQPEKEETSSHWLRFEKDVEVTDEDGKLKICRIAIAYSLAEEERKKKQLKWKIAPLDRGEVSIYFPAEKETSNLRFHIHAPFASTVARDSVRDCQANKDLRDYLAKLVVESLEAIRDRGMLDVSFLAVIPNPTDNLPEFYEPIRKTIIEAFCEQDFTPTRSGEHRSAGALYRGPAKIADVLEDKGLSSLTKFSVPLWAANAPQENQREDRFIQSLEIDEWGWSELVSIFKLPHPYARQDNEKTENSEHKEIIQAFIQQKSDAELMRFYALLGEAVDTHHKSVDVEGLRIVRVTNDGVDRHVAPKEAYLPSEAETSSPSDVFFVKPEVYSAGRSDSQKKYAKYFLGEIGVRPYDEKAAVEKILKEHYSETNFKPSKNDLKSFIALLEKNTGKASLFTSYRIFECQDGEWRKPCQTFLDQPFMDTGLSAYYDAMGEMVKSFSLSDSYKGCGISPPRLAKFAEAVGVQTELKITETKCKKNPQWPYLSSAPGSVRTWTGVDRDYEIIGLEKIFDETTFENLLLEPSLAISKLIWKRMCSLPPYPDCLTATFSYNQSNFARNADSILIHQLRNFPWVPQDDGVDFVKFVRPTDAVQRLLPQNQGFQFDHGWRWIKAIQFGEEAVKKSELYRQKQSSAQSLDFESVEEANKAAKLVKLMAERGHSIDDEIAKLERADLPEKVSLNPERRTGKIADETRSTPEKIREARERTVDPDYVGAQDDARTYLKYQYTNADSVMFCQLCQDSQPVILNGEPHFEAVDCVSGINFHCEQNNLALCPNHAAMYKNGGLVPDALQRAILECEGQKILLNLAGNEVELYFTQQHLGDLRAALSALDSKEI